MHIEFVTDGNEMGNAFSIDVRQEPCNAATEPVHDCGQHLQVDQKRQLIGARAPRYANHLNCVDSLNVPSRACGLNVYIHRLSIEGQRPECMFDYLLLYDKRFCGQLRDERVLMPFAPDERRRPFDVPVKFVTDGSFVSTGFNISYGWVYTC